MLASNCSTRSQQSTCGEAVGRGVCWNALIRREKYFPIARHQGAAEGRNGRGSAANRERARCLDWLGLRLMKSAIAAPDCPRIEE